MKQSMPSRISGKGRAILALPFSRFALPLLCLLLLLTLSACSGPNAASSTAADTAGAGSEPGKRSEESASQMDAASPTETPDAHTAVLEEQAAQVVASMRTGDFASVVSLFNDELAAVLTADALQAGWDQTIEPLGAYIGHISATGEMIEDSCAVTVLEKYEGNGILVRVSFDSNDRLQGLWITYQDVSDLEVADPSSAFQEDAVPVPAVPENVTEEEILVSGNPDYPLPGILTLPDGVERPPVVILVHGSGSSDRNETLNGNAPFRDIAWGLAEQGIASIRYDKRYYVYPQAAADPSAVTIEAEVLEDVDAAIALAANDPRLDSGRIYVLGHSLGGMLTPVIADAHPELAGIISMAGSLRPLWDIVYDQNSEAAAAARPSLSEEESRLLDSQLAQVEADVQTLRQLADDGQLADPALWPDSFTDGTLLLGILLSYWSSLERTAGAHYIDNVTMPILILQGDADFQVYPDKDYSLWQSTLAGRDNAVFHLYNGLNHMMMPTQGRRDITEYAVKNTVSGEVIADIADFIFQESN